ncbi:protein FAM184A-like [Liolophura sinensis]|uniref:protein FAM184A-like n=1 Tax=Liolophura sinensis TaxID=3198878 RepID=UPI003159170B
MADFVPRKSFEFRMSKKVAELTQVVHMLFTRNHEKEVEIDALKDAYECDIQLLLDDANQKILVRETRIAELEKLYADQATHFKEAVERESNGCKEEWANCVAGLERQLQDEKSECQNLRDLLIQTQKDVEKLRQSAMEDSSSKTSELQAKDQEISKLKKANVTLEKRVKEQQAQEEARAVEFTMKTDRLTRDITQLQELLEETHRVKENVITKNRQLEADLKQLRKDFGRKVSEIVSSKNSIAMPAQISNQVDYNSEIERLRREVHKYRMELSNRDLNFNRMFTDKQPIVIDPRAGKIGVNQIQAVNPHHRAPSTPPKTSREKSFSFASGQVYDHDVMPTRSLSSASSNARLPCLGSQDSRGRIQRLLKPRPIPKTFLMSKT